MVVATSSLRAELNGAEKGGPEHDAEIFGQVTDLFLSHIDQLNASQLNAVDGVRTGLIGRVQPALLIELGEALSTMGLAPRQTVRGLAFHDDPQSRRPCTAQVELPVGNGSACHSQ